MNKLALDFKTYQEKENRHKSVVDPIPEGKTKSRGDF